MHDSTAVGDDPSKSRVISNQTQNKSRTSHRFFLSKTPPHQHEQTQMVSFFRNAVAVNVIIIVSELYIIIFNQNADVLSVFVVF